MGNIEKKQEEKGIDWFFVSINIIPYIFLGTYFIGWITFFRISAIIILFALIFNSVYEIKNGFIRTGIFHLVVLLIFMEIGYLIMDNFLDGICMGMYVGVIASQIETLLKHFFYNKGKLKDHGERRGTEIGT